MLLAKDPARRPSSSGLTPRPADGNTLPTSPTATRGREAIGRQLDTDLSRKRQSRPGSIANQFKRPLREESKWPLLQSPLHRRTLPMMQGPQHMQALARANRVRLARAELKRSIARGETDASTVVRDCPWETESMTLAELLTSQRRWGRTRARKFLLGVALNENKRLGTLTERQRALLASALAEKGSRRPLGAARLARGRRPPALKESPPEARWNARLSAMKASDEGDGADCRRRSRGSVRRRRESSATTRTNTAPASRVVWER